MQFLKKLLYIVHTPYGEVQLSKIGLSLAIEPKIVFQLIIKK